jgi:hypothetical protein
VQHCQRATVADEWPIVNGQQLLVNDLVIAIVISEWVGRGRGRIGRDGGHRRYRGRDLSTTTRTNDIMGNSRIVVSSRITHYLDIVVAVTECI